MADFPPPAVVIAIAKALKVTTDELLGVKTPKKPKDDQLLDPTTRRLWKKFQKIETLPEKDQRAVIRLINSLVSAQQNAAR